MWETVAGNLIRVARSGRCNGRNNSASQARWLVGASDLHSSGLSGAVTWDWPEGLGQFEQRVIPLNHQP